MSDAISASTAPPFEVNAVTTHLLALRAQWVEHAMKDGVSLIVWRVRQDSQQLLDAFIASQQSAGAISTPEVFVRIKQPFETCFAYSRDLQQRITDLYRDNEAELHAQAQLGGWRPPHLNATEEGSVLLLSSLVEHCKLSGLVIVPTSPRSSDISAFTTWLEGMLEHMRRPIDGAARLRLLLLDHFESPRWQSLLGKYKAESCLFEDPVPIWDVMHNVAQEQGAQGKLGRQQKVLTDAMNLLAKGDAPAVQSRVSEQVPALHAQGWHGQSAVMHMIAAGAWLGAKDSVRALDAYKQSRQAATQALDAGDETGGQLIMQSWFGEAGVWLSDQGYAQAADGYLQAAAAAKVIAHAMFELEGLRCAAKCWWMHGDRERAADCALNALDVARQMSESDRPQTTVALLLQDLLAMNQTPAARRLEDLAQTYEKELAKAQKQADLAVRALGNNPSSDAVSRVDQSLSSQYEQAFSKLLLEREKVIEEANKNFKAIIALGRAWLHPSWSGMPDVAHPLDKEPAQWTDPPVYVVSPDAQAVVELS